MFEEFLNNEPADLARTRSADASRAPNSKLLARRFEVKVYSIVLGIVLAGAAYGLLFVLVHAIFEVIMLFIGGGNQYFWSPGVVEVIAAISFGTVAGLCLATIVSAFVLPFVYFFVRSLGLPGSIIRLGAFSGGLVGFVAVMPLLIWILFEAPQNWWQQVFIVLVGPALTTLLGQTGGAWGAWRVGRYERVVAKASVSDERNSQGNANESRDFSGATGRFQFGVRHLLVISLWVSLLLTAIRLSGFGFGFGLTLLFGWVVYQAVTLWIGGVLAARIVRWRARRQSRST